MSDQVTDEQLARFMAAAQSGAGDAYAALLKAILPRLRAMIRNRRRFLSEADIEDLVQDTLVSLHSVRATYDPSRPFWPWLFAIARNRLADGARRHARRSANEVSVPEYPVTFSAEEANWDAEGYGDPEILREAIDRLPAAQRQAVDLLKIKELSLREASVESGMSVGALKVSMHRAMTTLKKALRKS